MKTFPLSAKFGEATQARVRTALYHANGVEYDLLNDAGEIVSASLLASAKQIPDTLQGQQDLVKDVIAKQTPNKI
jgi:hypothetical protein